MYRLSMSIVFRVIMTGKERYSGHWQVWLCSVMIGGCVGREYIKAEWYYIHFKEDEDYILILLVTLFKHGMHNGKSIVVATFSPQR